VFTNISWSAALVVRALPDRCREWSMTDEQAPGTPPLLIVTAPGNEPQTADVIAPEQEGAAGVETIERPAMVLRIGSMIKQLLDEVRAAPLDQASRLRLKEIYEQSVRELASGLSPELAAELDRLVLPFESDEPSDAELRIAQAQLVGWLEGLFHGIQATLFAQQMSSRAQLENMRSRGLPSGQDGDDDVVKRGYL
jgi:hypothetical protein